MNILSLPRRILKYIRTDLKEIALPSSLPDPPDYVPPRRTTWIERWQVRLPSDVALTNQAPTLGMGTDSTEL